MRLIQIHPFSAMAGASCVLAALGLSGMMVPPDRQPLSGPFPVAAVPTAPAAIDMVRITEGNPYTVPPGRTLVVNGLGDTEAGTNVDPLTVKVQFDGMDVIGALLFYSASQKGAAGAGPTITPVPPGLAAPAGTVVSVSSSAFGGLGVLLAYLE